MSAALLWVGLFAVAMLVCTVLTYQAADRPGDDFGAGVLVWLCGLLFIVAVLAWVILAAIHWWPS